MTQKDLLYLEDACNHESNLISIYEYLSSLLEEENLCNILSSQIKKHENIKKKILKLLKESTNE